MRSRAQRGRPARRFYHDTGEGSISSYHRERGGDLVWEIGSATSAAATRKGRFDAALRRNARDPRVKMIELKLCRAPSGHGGMRPAKVTARRRGRARRAGG